MLTAERWVVLLNSKISRKRIKARLAQDVREYLSTLMVGDVIGTNEVVEAIFPKEAAEATRKAFEARAEIFRLIGQLANDGLDDCCIKGDVEGQFMGKPKRPWRWFYPNESDKCPSCGQALPAEIEG